MKKKYIIKDNFAWNVRRKNLVLIMEASAFIPLDHDRLSHESCVAAEMNVVERTSCVKQFPYERTR